MISSVKKRKISSWWVYQADSDVEALRPLCGTLDSLSLHCTDFEVSRQFITNCRAALGCEILQLVDYRSGPYGTPEELKKTVEQLVGHCEAKGFDGIDLDYEFQPPESRAAYSELIEQVAARLKTLGKKLSICVGYYYFTHQNPPDHGFIDPEVVARFCDEVRVMCYDQNFAPGKGLEPFDRVDCQGIGPTSTQPWARSAMLHWASLVPREKLVMGLPAYSNDYDIRPGGYGQALYMAKPPVDESSTDKSWQWYDQINIYRYEDANKVPRIFYASDHESTRAHLSTASAMDISAISFWEARSVPEAMWTEVRQWRNAEQAI